MISEAKDEMGEPESTTNNLPVFLIDLAMVVLSKGLRDLRSIS